ncbi:MAG: response regulator transcription factor [Sulfurovum sp.]|uniref:response regulator transcription factor n=1 Tax=Sulfurovum sp. TaxID=1969726 RepID=UPI002867E2C0|nr:response regulator transcription factor [Sulfurovum sp.]MCO4844637.1 response regulator transcription factor [Sulfurovum sp.]
MKVLIIEDDVQLNIAISEFCKIKAFDTVSVKDGLKALDQIDSGDFDLYIIDINIPRINGLDLLKHIRKTDLDTPIIIITASLEIQNFSTAFENGCSEYIKKPFHLKELDIRINNLLTLKKPVMITLNDELTYDLSSEEFYYQNRPIKLRYKEKRFCAILMKHIDTVVSNEMVYDYVWEGEIKETYPLRQLLVELRKKLPFDIIQTKIREGYIIEKELMSLSSETKP